MRHPSRFILLATFALLLAGCGVSGGNDAADREDASTTTEATTTTEKKAPTAKQLEALLPDAADVGPDYKLKPSDDDEDSSTTTTGPDGSTDDPTEKAFTEACPEAAALDLTSDDENADEVKVEFATEKDQGIEVSLDPTPKGFEKGNVDDIVAAFNTCGTISYDDPDTGKVTMKLKAADLDGFGDYGADVTLSASFEIFGAPLEIAFHGYLFVVDGIGVTVTSTGGIDEATFAAVPGDDDLLDPLAAEMEKRVHTLTD